MELEKMLALHCGPVLLRRKPAALFTLPYEPLHTGELDRALAHHGLRRFILCDRCEKALVMVYDQAALQRRLREGVPRRTLWEIGYPMDAPLEEQLDYLRRRVWGEEAFPHEIGFFLGYPQEDVLGFMRHKGKHCKLCGLWKVYGDVPRAVAMFEEFRACTRRMLHHLENGGTLYDLPGEWVG